MINLIYLWQAMKRLNCKILLFIIMLIMNFSDSYSKEKNKLIFNAGADGSTKYYVNWHTKRKLKDLKEWAATYGFELLSDGGSIVDNKAFIVSNFGSYLYINDNTLKKYRSCNLYIDFVSYKKIAGAKISSRLKIILINSATGYAEEEEILFNETLSRPHVIRLSYELISHGKIEVFFREYSMVTGIWGVWDIYLIPDY